MECGGTIQILFGKFYKMKIEYIFKKFDLNMYFSDLPESNQRHFDYFFTKL